ncbi:MAG: C39 family peptidase [Hormoscilla sp.]
MLKYCFYFCVLCQIINFFILVAPSLANPITPYRTLRYEGVVGQTTYYTCGAAAVATLLTHYYDRPTTEAEILALSETAMAESSKILEETGITALALIQALDDRGIQARGMRLTLTSLAEYFGNGGLPVVLHVTKPQMHYVLAVGMVGDWIILADPSWGRRIQPLDALVNEQGFSGVTLVPVPPENLIFTVKEQQNETLSWAESRLVTLNSLRRKL